MYILYTIIIKKCTMIRITFIITYINSIICFEGVSKHKTNTPNIIVLE